MSEKTINFGDKKINKKDVYNNKKQFNIEDIDINKILISKPESYDKNNMRKYIIGYNDKTIRSLQLVLPKNVFLNDNNEFLERCTAILKKNDLVNKNKYINTTNI